MKKDMLQSPTDSNTYRGDDNLKKATFIGRVDQDGV